MCGWSSPKSALSSFLCNSCLPGTWQLLHKSDLVRPKNNTGTMHCNPMHPPPCGAASRHAWCPWSDGSQPRWGRSTETDPARTVPMCDDPNNPWMESWVTYWPTDLHLAGFKMFHASIWVITVLYVDVRISTHGVFGRCKSLPFPWAWVQRACNTSGHFKTQVCKLHTRSSCPHNFWSHIYICFAQIRGRIIPEPWTT